MLSTSLIFPICLGLPPGLLCAAWAPYSLELPGTPWNSLEPNIKRVSTKALRSAQGPVLELLWDPWALYSLEIWNGGNEEVRHFISEYIRKSGNIRRHSKKV